MHSAEYAEMADAGHDVEALSVRQLRELVTSAGNACSSLGVLDWRISVCWPIALLKIVKL
jgi:hypothetical protein